jgi:hypothetical protein
MKNEIVNFFVRAGVGAAFVVPLRLIDKLKLELILSADALSEVLPYGAGAAGMVVCAELIKRRQNHLYYLLSGVVAVLSVLGYQAVSDWLPSSGLWFLWVVLCCFLYTLVYFSYSFFWYSVYDYMKAGVKKARAARGGGAGNKAGKAQGKQSGNTDKTP